MIHVTEAEQSIILDILARRVPACEVRAFGSRVTGKHRPYSDLDLAIIAPEALTIGQMARVKDDFEASDLPFRVDVLDWRRISPEFQKTIETRFEIIQQPAQL